MVCFKQKTTYEMRISYWSSDVCSSDLQHRRAALEFALEPVATRQRARIADNGGGRHRAAQAHLQRHHGAQIGRASCRERVCQYVWISVVAVSLKQNTTQTHTISLQEYHISAAE